MWSQACGWSARGRARAQRARRRRCTAPGAAASSRARGRCARCCSPTTTAPSTTRESHDAHTTHARAALTHAHAHLTHTYTHIRMQPTRITHKHVTCRRADTYTHCTGTKEIFLPLLNYKNIEFIKVHVRHFLTKVNLLHRVVLAVLDGLLSNDLSDAIRKLAAWRESTCGNKRYYSYYRLVEKSLEKYHNMAKILKKKK